MDNSNTQLVRDEKILSGAPDLTVLIPFYDRLKHFKAYWDAGRWEGVRLQLICDGSTPDFVDELKALVHVRSDVAVHAYSPNRGSARARAEGFERIATSYVAACDDDDFIEEAPRYALNAAELFGRNPDTLLVTARYVVAFNESGASQIQYDRRWMDGITGRQLLDFIVRSGEIQALMPSVFRTSDVRDLEVNELFKRNQDLVLLVRLCARFPDHKVRVLDDARYMRLIHENSISSRRDFSVEHMYNHALAMTVGAFHLANLGGISHEEFSRVLRKRGDVIQNALGGGREVFAVFASLVLGNVPHPASDEGRQTLGLLQRDALELPSEYHSFVPVQRELSTDSDEATGSNEPHTYETLKEDALKRYEEGDVVGAVQCLAEAVKSDPGSKDAYVLLATLYEEQNDVQGAIDLLHRAASLDERDPQVHYALGVLCEQVGRHAAAQQHLTTAVAEFDRLAAELQVVADNSSSVQKADVIKNLDALQPTIRDARKRLNSREEGEVNSTSELKIAVVCGPHQKFINDTVERLRRNHDVRTVFAERERGHGGSFRLDLSRLQEALDWADVAWFEWCDDILLQASRQLRKSAAVVCRLHSFEAFTDVPQHVDWSFVDHVVFVAEHIREIVQEAVPLLPPSSVIVNGVDLDKLKYVERERDFNVAYLGYINFKKNPELLLQIAAKLKEHDARYQLHVAGEFQERRYAIYFKKMIQAMGLENNFRFYGWIDDIDSWLVDKNYIVSTSLLEGCPVGLIEAMAKGLKPVVHNWPGADRLYPGDFLFNTVDEAVARIMSSDYDSASYRAFVAERHDAKMQAARIDELLRQTVERANLAAHADAVEEKEPAPDQDSVESVRADHDEAQMELITREELEALRLEWGNSDWAATLDFLSEMVRLASTTDGPVLECGSGLTTVVLALLGKVRPMEIWTLEHDYEWYCKVRNVLEQHGLTSVNLCYAPLKQCGSYEWFDAPLNDMPNSFDFIICDGPPGKSRGGRYGMLPEMAGKLRNTSVILFDDIRRSGEQEVVRRWSQQYGLSMQEHGTERPFGVLRFRGTPEHVAGSIEIDAGSAEAA